MDPKDYVIITKHAHGLGLRLTVQFKKELERPESGLEQLMLDLVYTFEDGYSRYYPSVEISLRKKDKAESLMVRAHSKWGADEDEIHDFCLAYVTRHTNMDILEVDAIPLPPVLKGVFANNKTFTHEAFKILHAKLIDPFTLSATIKFNKVESAGDMIVKLMHELVTCLEQDNGYLWPGVRIEIREMGKMWTTRTIDVRVQAWGEDYDEYEVAEFGTTFLNGRKTEDLDSCYFKVKAMAMKPIITGDFAV
jgi:hypothetical protein